MSESCPGVVLIVDGDSTNAASLHGELNAAGYVVLDASDAAGALSQLNSHHVDVVITELRLAGGDGLQLIDHIRRASPDTRVIVATAHGSIETAVEAMKRGSIDFLTRPLNGGTVLKKIREACSSRRNGREALAATASGRSIESSMGQMNAFVMPASLRAGDSLDGTGGLTETMADLERSLIEAALKRASGNQAKAAQFLRIPRTTLRDKMAKYGMVGDSARRQPAASPPVS